MRLLYQNTKHLESKALIRKMFVSILWTQSRRRSHQANESLKLNISLYKLKASSIA